MLSSIVALFAAKDIDPDSLLSGFSSVGISSLVSMPLSIASTAGYPDHYYNSSVHSSNHIVTTLPPLLCLPESTAN